MNIVSGFIHNINRRVDRDITKYLQFGLELMAVEIPMTVFIEKAVFEEHILPLLTVPIKTAGSFVYRATGGVMDGLQQTYFYQVYGHVTFVYFEIHHLFLWPYRKMAHQFQLNTGNPCKDTLEYMMVQCQKTEWMAIAIQFREKHNALGMTGNECKEYIWVDFGSFHMFHGKIDIFQTELYKLRSRVNARITTLGESSHVCLASCWNPNATYYGDIHKDIHWLFAGSVFGGGANVLNQFATEMREKCMQILREKNTLMWEINIWAILYWHKERHKERHKEQNPMFVLYPSDHSDIIFRGYS